MDSVGSTEAILRPGGDLLKARTRMHSIAGAGSEDVWDFMDRILCVYACFI